MNSHSFIFETGNCSELELLIVAGDVWGNSGPDAVAGEEEGGRGWGCVHVRGAGAHGLERGRPTETSGDSFCRNSALLEFPNLHVNECGVTFRSPWDGREDERR